MDADYDIFEIVAVIHDFWLIDAESYQRRYCNSHGKPLAPGFYVVNWPDHIQARRFNEHAAFHGPFSLRKEAKMNRDWMHQEREQFLTLSSENGFIATPKSNRLAMKKAASHRLRPLKWSTL